MLVAVAAVVAVLGASGCGSAHHPAAGTGSPAPVSVDSAYFLQVQATVLVDARGYALYVFAPDRDRAVTCTALCAGSWPPLLVDPGKPTATGAGVNAELLGSDPDPAGGRVVTYGGWPLYHYSADVQPKIATGQAIDVDGGYWYLITPDGKPVVPAGDGTAPVVGS